MVGVLDGVELFLKSTCRALEELVDLILGSHICGINAF